MPSTTPTAKRAFPPKSCSPSFRSTAEPWRSSYASSRALQQIHRAAHWWSENRPAAPGAIDFDLKEALDLLVEQPAIGGRVDNARDGQVRRFYLVRTRHFIYYRAKGELLEIIAFWHASREQAPRV